MTPVHLVVPGTLDQRTGGYLYDRHIVAGLRVQGREVVVHELAGRFPHIDLAARAAAAEAVEAVADGTPVIDGLALPAFADLTDLLPPWVALIHHPLALETGLTDAEAAALDTIERRLVRQATRVIVTSRQTVADLASYKLPSDRIGVVLPGTAPAPLARGSAGPGLELLCVASLTLRKGHLVLLEALAGLVDLDWHLTCVGSPAHDPTTAAAISKAVSDLGLSERVSLAGELDEAGLAPHYAAADLFVLASFHEGYGMALAEALARGLPIVSTDAGAIPGTVPASAGILVGPGDPAALANALRRVISEPALRAGLAEGAAAERARLPSWPRAAQSFAAELDQVGR